MQRTVQHVRIRGARRKSWKKRRTIADAIDVLQKFAGFEGTIVPKFNLAGYGYPRDRSLVLRGFHLKARPIERPSSSSFCQRRLNSRLINLLVGDIGRLEGATLDEKGNVELQDGTLMRAVEITPALLPYEISSLDRAIVALTLSQMNALDICSYSSGGVFLDHSKDDPDVGFIDCSKLAGLNVPILKVIKGHIADRAPNSQLFQNKRSRTRSRKIWNTNSC